MRLFKRGGVWWCRVRDARGRIVRKSTHCRDYEAAVVSYRELEKQGADPAYAKAASTRIDGCIESYFDELERRKVAAATLKKETTKAGHFIRLWPRDLPMSAITSPLVEEYIRTREREGVTPHTVKMELQTLTRVLKVAKHHGTFQRAIEEVMPIKYGSGHKPKKRAPTPDEVKALLSQFTTSRSAHLAYIVATGCRLSESYRARRKHYDPVTGVVYVDGTKTEGAASEVAVTEITRGLLEWALEHAPGKDQLFRPWGKLHRDVAAACVRAEIEKVTPNDLRRSFGTWHRAAGVPIDLLARQLRHTTDKLAQTTYARLGGEQVRALLNAKMTVSGLYLPKPQTDPIESQPESPNSSETSAPGRNRTCDQRFRKAEPKPARSVGNTKAWEMRGGRECADSVRIPPCPEIACIEHPQRGELLAGTFPIGVGADALSRALDTYEALWAPVSPCT